MSWSRAERCNVIMGKEMKGVCLRMKLVFKQLVNKLFVKLVKKWDMYDANNDSIHAVQR